MGEQEIGIYKGEYYKNRLIKLSKEIEELRTEIYKQIDNKDTEKDYFNNQLFKIQSMLGYKMADLAELLEYKGE